MKNLLKLLLITGWILPLSMVIVWAQTTGPVPESLVFVDDGIPQIDASFVPTFTRDVDFITVQVTFSNTSGQPVGLGILAKAQVKDNPDTDEFIATFTCQRVDGPEIDSTPVADCQDSIIVAPGSGSSGVNTTIQLTFFSGDLSGVSTIAQQMELQVLIDGGTASQQSAVSPIGSDTRERLEFTLNPPPPSVSIEGPVNLNPAIPRQGEIVSVTFILANSRGTPQPYRLVYELKNLRDSDFLPLDFLRIASNCVRCALSGTLAGNERRVVEVQFRTEPLTPTFDPLDAISVTVTADAASASSTNGNGNGNTLPVSGIVEQVTVFDGEVFVLLQSAAQGRLWIKIVGPVTGMDNNPISPQDIRAGMAISAEVERDPTFQASPIGQSNPEAELVNPYLLQITVNPQATNTSNQLVVGFTLREPIRQLNLNAPTSLSTVSDDTTVRFNVSVFNDSPLFLANNFVDLDLVQVLNTDGVTTESIVPLDGTRCTIRPLSGSLFGLVRSCPSILFDLNPFESMTFEIAFDTTALPEGEYRFDIEVGPSGVSDSVALSRDLIQAVDFRVQPGAVAGGDPDGDGTSTATRGPELRPTELNVVPSTTVEQGDSLVLLSTIRNGGNMAAEDIEVIFSLRREDDSGASFEAAQAVHFFPRLGIGLTLEARQAFDTASLSPGRYRVKVEVRLVGGNAAELDPDNNVLEAIINIVEPSE